MSMKSVRAVISGRVQGVCYRAWTAEQAGKLGLRGWVRNRTNGMVEALFIGPAEDVDAMIAKCRRGPSLAHVVDIELTPIDIPADAPDGPGFYTLSTV